MTLEKLTAYLGSGNLCAGLYLLPSGRRLLPTAQPVTGSGVLVCSAGCGCCAGVLRRYRHQVCQNVHSGCDSLHNLLCQLAPDSPQTASALSRATLLHNVNMQSHMSSRRLRAMAAAASSDERTSGAQPGQRHKSERACLEGGLL